LLTARTNVNCDLNQDGFWPESPLDLSGIGGVVCDAVSTLRVP
jgi:hypothetical protein